jgi:hypothetical protein
MKPKFDFSKARRGPLVPKDPNKTLVSIRLDNHALNFLGEMIDRSGGGSLENLINNVLRAVVVLSEQSDAAERDYFFKQAARVDSPNGVKLPGAEVTGSPGPINRLVETRGGKARPKKAASISAK